MKSFALAGVVLATVVSAQAPLYGQCGGIGWKGATTCAAGSVCTVSNPYYSQCLPGSGGSPPPPVSTVKTSATTTFATSTKPSSSPTTAPSSGKTRFAGVNIAGFDFGCGTDGTCDTTQAYGATGGSHPDGAGQMKHFVNDDGLNIFRLPVAWQWLTPTLGGSLNSANLASYDTLVQGCLATGAYCIIDIHNYARWNGAIIGQGGPTNAQFASVWSQIASKYAGQSRIVFGIMNEPHDVPNINTWGQSVQAAVTAIRQAGATSQLILLPGNNYTSAQQFVSNGSAAALIGVKNLDGSTTNLIFDVHKYLDSDNSGTHAECTTDNVASTFTPLATYLRSVNRQALLSETGGGNVASCEQYLCNEVAYLNANSDVYLGYIGWSAGSFDNTYVLTETPTNNGGRWTDTALVSQCIARH